MPTVQTTPFADQKARTSGLRKRVTRFREPHYLENFVQSVFDSIDVPEGGLMVLGGDGRYHNDVAIRTILRMAAANGVSRVMVGRAGIFSTPAVSHAIRKHRAFGGIILSASHNPGGPDGDFGIKYNGANGGPAPEKVTDAIYARSREIGEYRIADEAEIDLDTLGRTTVDGMAVEIVDPVEDYAALMAEIFDFDAIRALVAGGFDFRFDAMHAVTGPYAKRIFGEMLGVPADALMNCEPSPTFGDGHPDPNRVHAKHLFAMTADRDGADLACASDGDGDRNLVVGKQCFVAPSDSLAALAANLHFCPGYPGRFDGRGSVHADLGRGRPRRSGQGRGMLRNADGLEVLRHPARRGPYQHMRRGVGWDGLGPPCGRRMVCGPCSRG